jgi:membrane-bound lytic murein transglycosylase B
MILHHRSKEKQANENLHASQLPTLKAHVIAYQKVYDRVEAVYGVNREVIAAILLKETQLGHIKLTHDAFVTLNTIIKTLPSTTDRNKRLLNMAKNNISALIHYCHDNDIAPKACQFQSSYAGAVGIAQFMPQNFQYVKAYDKGLGDLNKMEDAIASVANYLYQRVGFDTLIEWDRLNDIKNIETAWDHYSHNNEYATFIKIDYPQERDHCFACERDDLNYINQQMIKILDYNNTDNYALGVLSLGYALHQQLRK